MAAPGLIARPTQRFGHPESAQFLHVPAGAVVVSLQHPYATGSLTWARLVKKGQASPEGWVPTELFVDHAIDSPADADLAAEVVDEGPTAELERRLAEALEAQRRVAEEAQALRRELDAFEALGSLAELSQYRALAEQRDEAARPSEACGPDRGSSVWEELRELPENAQHRELQAAARPRPGTDVPPRASGPAEAAQRSASAPWQAGGSGARSAESVGGRGALPREPAANVLAVGEGSAVAAEPAEPATDIFQAVSIKDWQDPEPDSLLVRRGDEFEMVARWEQDASWCYAVRGSRPLEYAGPREGWVPAHVLERQVPWPEGARGEARSGHLASAGGSGRAEQLGPRPVQPPADSRQPVAAMPQVWV